MYCVRVQIIFLCILRKKANLKLRLYKKFHYIYFEMTPSSPHNQTPLFWTHYIITVRNGPIRPYPALPGTHKHLIKVNIFVPPPLSITGRICVVHNLHT